MSRTSGVLPWPRPKGYFKQAKVSAKGWIVIPKAIRQEMDIKPGDVLDVVDPNLDSENALILEKRVGNLWTYLETSPSARLVGKAKVSSKGWVLIPKELREKLKIEPGDELQITQNGFGRIQVAKPIEDILAYMDKYMRIEGDWTMDDWLRWKQEEREDEERRDQAMLDYFSHADRSRRGELTIRDDPAE